MLSYSTSCSYKPTYPSHNYPSAAPYAALTKLFHKLIKDKVIHNRLLKQLLYPEYLNKMNLSLVKIRHHKTECVIMTKASCCRFSIVRCDSDTDSDTDTDNGKMPRQNAIDRSSSESDDNDSSSSSSNPFGYIRYYNPQTGSRNEVETRYESFIDYGEPIYSSAAKMAEEESEKKASVTLTSTAKLQLMHQTSESSDASSLFVPKPYLACEDLVNIDENTEMNLLREPKLFVPTTRQSLPTKFVANKFSVSSLTTIDVPEWQSHSDNQLNCRSKFTMSKQRASTFTEDSSSCTTTTHSSSLDLVVNPLPLPDKIVAELLYNFDSTPTDIDFTKSESVDSDHTDKSFKTVIKPPSVFQNVHNDSESQRVSDAVSLNLENIGFRKHSINSDKPRRRSSIHVIHAQDNGGIRRCVSTHFVRVNNQDRGCSDSACCLEMCHSPRSSDSGMAGSCTLNSPDFGANDHERCSMDLSDQCKKHNVCAFGDPSNVMSLSDIEASDFNSQCPCTSPFGSTPRTSCQTSSSENIITGSHDSMRTSLTSLDISLSQRWELEPKTHSRAVNISPELLTSEPPRCIQQWEPALKSRSLDFLIDKHKVACHVDEPRQRNEKAEIFKSGLYAHWWLKAKIPASVVKGIYEETRSPHTGKGF